MDRRLEYKMLNMLPRLFFFIAPGQPLKQPLRASLMLYWAGGSSSRIHGCSRRKVCFGLFIAIQQPLGDRHQEDCEAIVSLLVPS